MADIERPQIYLITPPDFELSSFPMSLDAVLAAEDIACVRLALATKDEDKLARAADAIREVCHTHDVALVIENHVMMVERLGLDGVHLLDGSRSVRKTRKELGPDSIVGAFCHASSHDGMVAGEAGADYVAFGPVGITPLGDGTTAPMDLFQWWSQMIEVPVVAEGALTAESIRALSPITDFFGIGDEIWKTDDPVQTLKGLIAEME